MKKNHLFKIAILSVFLISLLFMAGCRGSYNTSSNVIVQLQNGGDNYPVDGMTVSLQQRTGTIFTGVTDADGKATINVTLEGNYNVIQVAGVDASALAEGNATGREFVKNNPIADPYPYVAYTFGGIFPVINVPDFDSNYTINVTVPLINKVTVLKVGSVTTDDSGNITVPAGTAAFAGRVMMSNLSFSDANCTIGIRSSDANGNRIVLYENSTAVSSGDFWVTSPSSDTPIGTMAYALAGPIYFEAPGTNGGDWALGYNLSVTDLKVRSSFGGNVSTVNFLNFNGGGTILEISPASGSPPHTYSFDYRIFQFDPYLIPI